MVRARLRTNLHALTIDEVINKRFQLLKDLRDKVTADLRSELPRELTGGNFEILSSLVDGGARSPDLSRHIRQ